MTRRKKQATSEACTHSLASVRTMLLLMVAMIVAFAQSSGASTNADLATGSVKLDRSELSLEEAKKRYLESQEDALQYALLVKELQYQAKIDALETDEQADRAMRDAVMAEATSMLLSQDRIAEIIKDAPAQTKDAIMQATATEPGAVLAQLEKRLKDSEDTKKKLSSRLEKKQEGIKKAI